MYSIKFCQENATMKRVRPSILHYKFNQLEHKFILLQTCKIYSELPTRPGFWLSGNPSSDVVGLDKN